MGDKEYIKETDLNNIISTEEFFSVKAIAYLDLITLPDDYKSTKEVITYKDKKYLKIVLVGKPENLIINMPIVRKTILGEMVIGFDPKDLPMCILQKKIFNISRYYQNLKYCKKTDQGYVYNLRVSDKFFIDNYLLPYI